VQALNILHRTSLSSTHSALVDFKRAIKKEVRGESLPGKPGGTGFAKPVHRFWAVCIFHCASASPKIPDFPETPGKIPEYSGFTNKIVLSGDFQDLPIQPPLGDIKILSAPVRPVWPGLSG
jgi:hypothetical protein